jgi:competence protein ComEC
MTLDTLFLNIFDVEHGSAAYLRTPNGKHIVFDLGVGSYKNNDDTFSPLYYLWSQWNVQRLDHLIITHPHRDHLDDIGNLALIPPAVLHHPASLTEQEIRKGNKPGDSEFIDRYIAWVQAYNQPVSAGLALSPQNLGGVELSIFSSPNCPRSNLNNHSLVSVVSYAGARIILPGDNEKQSWLELLSQPAFVSAIQNTTILLAPHHGRESGWSDELFQYISRTLRLTIVSDTAASSTSITGMYSAQSAGWEVFSRSDSSKSEIRRCLTTRSDKGINIECGWNYFDDSPPRTFTQVRTA